MTDDPNKKTVAQLADQIVATWPDSWFRPRPIEAMKHVADLRTTSGQGMDLQGSEAEAVDQLINILGKEVFARDITQLLSFARDKASDKRIAQIQEKIKAVTVAKNKEWLERQEARELDNRKRRDAIEREEKKKRAARELEEYKRRESADREVREIREAESKARELLLTNLKDRIIPKFKSDFLGADAVFAQNSLWVGLEEDYNSLKNDFLRNWFREDEKSSGRLLSNLDPEQLQAIGSVDGNFQVVARAGSGKTTVSVYRAYFLIKHCKIRSDQILLLAFNRDAALEIRRRLLFLFKPDAEKLYKSKRSKLIASGDKGVKSIFDIESQVVGDLVETLGIELPFAMTFHALAYAIVRPEGEVLKDDPSSKDRTLSATVQGLVDEVLKDQEKASSIRDLMMRHFRNDWEFFNSEEYGMSGEELLLWRRSLPNQTIDGKYRKSPGEKVISDFLFEHSVEYHYERNFGWDNKNYRPDFTIMKPGSGKSGLVIEYFGLNDSAYVEQIENKRKYWHKKDSWKLIEVYPEDLAKGLDRLASILAPHIKSLGIPIRRLTDEEIWKLIEDDAILKYTELLTGFITRCRQIGWDSERLGQEIERHSAKRESVEGLFLKQAAFLFGAYEATLKAKGETDFSELIADAVHQIESGSTAFYRRSGNGNLASLRYIFVDEFQDFSFLFDAMVKAILNIDNQVSLFCVGDNWQAINGFAGSDLHYFENFQESIPNSKRIYLSTNYRSDANIVNFGNDVMAASSGFDQKAVPSKPSANIPLIGYLEAFAPSPTEIERSENDLITPALLRLIESQLVLDRDVVVLSRANSIPYYTDSSESGRKVKNLETFIKHLQSFFPEEISKRISINTAHRYKGRERQAVIILDANEKRYPLIHRDWIFSQIFGVNIPTLAEDDRRLFYVAATRAIDQLFVIAESRETLTPYVQEFGSGHAVLDWGEYRAPASNVNPLIVQVSGSTFSVKEHLSSSGFRYIGNSRIWQKAFHQEAFSVDELKNQSWASNHDDGVTTRLQVIVNKEPQGEVAQFEVRNGVWVTISDQLALLEKEPEGVGT